MFARKISFLRGTAGAYTALAKSRHEHTLRPYRNVGGTAITLKSFLLRNGRSKNLQIVPRYTKVSRSGRRKFRLTNSPITRIVVKRNNRIARGHSAIYIHQARSINTRLKIIPKKR